MLKKMPPNYLIVGGGGLVGTALAKGIADDSTDCNVFITGRSLKKENQIVCDRIHYHLNDELSSIIANHSIDCLVLMAFPRNVSDHLWAPGIDFCYDVLDMAKIGNVKRIIHISSQSVYGLRRTTPAAEDDMVNLFSPYTAGKYCVEQYINHNFRDIPHTNIRLATIIGPNTEERVVNKLVRQVVENKEIMIRSGEELFSFLDVRDAADALKILLQSEDNWEERYNVGSGNCCSLWNIAEVVCDIGKNYGYTPRLRHGNEHIEMNNTLDVSRFEKTFKWCAKYSIDDSIKTMYEKIRQDEST